MNAPEKDSHDAVSFSRLRFPLVVSFVFFLASSGVLPPAELYRDGGGVGCVSLSVPDACAVLPSKIQRLSTTSKRQLGATALQNSVRDE